MTSGRQGSADFLAGADAARYPAPRYQVRISVPRCGGWRAWLPMSGRFEQELTAQESEAVITAQVESETRRSRDYVRVTVLITVSASDVAAALDTAWWVFRRAASGDTSGWDMASATAEVQPG